MRPLCQRLQRQVCINMLLRHGFNGDGRTTVRPYKSLPVGLLHVGLLQRQVCINCYCVVVLTGTDAQTVRPYKSLHVGLLLRRGFNGDGRPPTRHFRASLQMLPVGLLPVGSLHNTK